MDSWALPTLERKLDPIDTPAQVPEAAGAQSENQPQNQGASEGAQKRFDELTAEKYELKRQLEDARAREQMFLAEAAARAQMAAQAARPQEPEVDPEFKRQVELAVRDLRQEMSRSVQQLQAQNAMMQVQSAAVQRGLPDPVRLKAAEITQGYLRQGHVIDPEVAFKMAAGEVYMEQLAKSQANGQALRNFNQPNPLLTQQGVMPAGQPQVQRKNYDGLSLDERIRQMEADGIGDVPF